MDPNINSEEFPPPPPSFSSNPPAWQDSAPRFRAQGYYQAPYPTSNPRMRQHGDFPQRGRYSYNKRGGGYRPQNRNKNYEQRQEQSADTNEYQNTATNSSQRYYNKFVRPNMLEDPWANMQPQRVPANGTSLVLDPTA